MSGRSSSGRLRRRERCRSGGAAPLVRAYGDGTGPALPWGTLLLVCLVSLAIGTLAAAVPARRAAALRALEAVAQS
ncbi:hypothetical protein [Streptomyces sp. WAC 06725]|uniref:hypothetical protein n=1 Tax=Streptomyces sp. WAC 06725 TaxID=2203209 RepID=UPI000F73C483|nr:hypothetical protein [Streptomyces sp. WAC 06725]